MGDPIHFSGQAFLVRFAAVEVLAAALLVCGAVPVAAADTGHVPGRLLVGRRTGMDVAAVDRAVRPFGARFRRRLGQLQISVLDVPEKSREAVAARLRATGAFDFVEPDYYAHTGATPDDPNYPSQWHLPQIHAPAAWSLTSGASSVVVAVIDSGVDGTHPDLKSKLLPGWSFVGNSSDTSDTMGHGTAVAGTVAAASNNALGIAGVTWGSVILPVVVVDANDFASYSDIAAAIEYAVNHGARIINLSIGGSSPSSALQTAVDYAWSKGAVLFAAAMNDSTSSPYYPAACNHVVAVSATDNYNHLAGFSDYGPWITLAAPGTAILTTMNGGGYGTWWGTSFSSPIVAGVAALMLAVNPPLENSTIVSLLRQTADNIGPSDYFGAGLVDAYQAVFAARPEHAAPAGPLPPIHLGRRPDSGHRDNTHE